MGLLTSRKRRKPCPNPHCKGGTEDLVEERMGRWIHWPRQCRTCRGRGWVRK